MKIVIDICVYTYNGILKGKEVDIDEAEVIDAVKNGVVLPKGHGALKDADKLAVAIAMIRDKYNYYGECEPALFKAYDNSVDEIIDAPTIIEADKEVEDADSD